MWTCIKFMSWDLLILLVHQVRVILIEKIIAFNDYRESFPWGIFCGKLDHCGYPLPHVVPTTTANGRTKESRARAKTQFRADDNHIG